MGQIWVRTKNHPGAEKLWGGSFVRFGEKNSAIYTKDIAKLVGCAGSITQKGKTKPQVTKPGVFGE